MDLSESYPAESSEEITLKIPEVLAEYLRAKKPQGMSMEEWVLVLLERTKRSEIYGAHQRVTRLHKQRIIRGPLARNVPCPCGSGMIFKACCDKKNT